MQLKIRFRDSAINNLGMDQENPIDHEQTNLS